MAAVHTNYSPVILEENISFTAAEITQWENQQKQITKIVPRILAGCTFFTMAFIAWVIRDNFASFHYYDYILLGAAGLALYFVCYFFAWLINWYDGSNWKKDKQHGKNKLTSTVIDRDKTEYGEYLSFAGPGENNKIRLKVREEDYRKYPTGSQLVVVYLKFTKEALEITEAPATH